MIVLLFPLKAIQYIMRVSTFSNIEKGVKSRNIWIVAVYLKLSHVGRIFSSAYSINILLYYHFPREQLVVFSDRESLFSISNEPKAQKTMLKMWSEANKEYSEA